MKILVLGANGATGFNVVTQLLKQGIYVKALTRNIEKFESLKSNENIEIIKAGILEMDNEKLKQYLSDVDGVISCLGHNITFKGVFGKPHRLVVGGLRKVIVALKEIKRDKATKIILMNTVGCVNKLQNESFKISENIILSILRVLVPPVRDNELALEYLTDTLGVDNKEFEWVAVRPDSLTNEGEVSEYTLHASTIRSPLFNPGKTSRINVANFMANLITDKDLWEKWKYKTPVIYNKE